MRTPNAQCIVCGKPLYRRPYELAKTRFAACMAHRAQAQVVAGITPEQKRGLSLGREKGTNHRTGYSHREESKLQTAAANKAFWAAHPELAMARGAKIRGQKNYLWKGGITKLNKAIRQMSENRKWMDAVKERDGCCTRCGATDSLESHHIIELAALMEQLDIKTCDDARAHASVLWDLTNGVTLCIPCHYAEHGRTYREAA